MTDTIFEQVRAIIAEQLDIDREIVTIDAHLRGERLRADSLDLVNLIMLFAQTFEVELVDEKIQKVSTVGDIVSYLRAANNHADLQNGGSSL